MTTPNGGHTAESDARITAVVEAHKFTSTSTSRNGFNTHYAGCACDPGIRFDWYEREAQHRAHVLAEVFAAGQASVTPPDDLLPDPSMRCQLSEHHNCLFAYSGCPCACHRTRVTPPGSDQR